MWGLERWKDPQWAHRQKVLHSLNVHLLHFHLSVTIFKNTTVLLIALRKMKWNSSAKKESGQFFASTEKNCPRDILLFTFSE